MIEHRYVCTGGCGANFTREAFDAVVEKKCQDQKCTGHGQPFVLRRWCTVCNSFLEPGTSDHQH